LKLYRGLKAREFSAFTPQIAKELSVTWKNILEIRAKGEFAYPTAINEKILKASRLLRLQRQHFTDQKKIALAYAKANGGTLVEIDVPVAQLLRNFTIEFQNFSQRKKAFEIIYVVDAAKLVKNAKRWKLKVRGKL